VIIRLQGQSDANILNENTQFSWHHWASFHVFVRTVLPA